MAQAPGAVIIVGKGEPGLLIRIVWFIVVGWWLSQLTIILGWLLNLTIIGIPAGLYLLNRIPSIATLKASRTIVTTSIDEQTGGHRINIACAAQRPFWQRALYFVFVGSWFSFIWLQVAWIFCILIVLLPLGFWMFGATGKVLTLKR